MSWARHGSETLAAWSIPSGSGELSPSEALEATIAAVEASPLNAFSFTDFERATEAARRADVSLPFGGVPFGVKELEKVQGWPYTEASVVFRDRVADHDDTSLSRLRATGAVLTAQTTAPEFGGINCTSTELHGTTRNPWNLERTPGGSSGGTAAAVAGGLLPIATGSDGGGSIRGPAGFSGLFGLKATYGRIPKGPDGTIEPMTTVLGCLTRSVRDTARYFDACNGFDRARSAEPAPGGGMGGRTRHPRSLRSDGRHRRRPRDRRGPRGGRRAGRRPRRGPGPRRRPPTRYRGAGPAAAAGRLGHGEPAAPRG